jgi:peptide/nickel transport system substrate-binding protein
MTIMFFNEPPSLVSLVSTTSLTCSAKVTEGLLWYDHDMQPHPQLVTTWTISPDQLTYAFTLRQGVKWHDGHDFTSTDVAASIAILRKFHPRGPETFAHVTEVQTIHLPIPPTRSVASWRAISGTMRGRWSV